MTNVYTVLGTMIRETLLSTVQRCKQKLAYVIAGGAKKNQYVSACACGAAAYSMKLLWWFAAQTSTAGRTTWYENLSAIQCTRCLENCTILWLIDQHSSAASRTRRDLALQPKTVPPKTSKIASWRSLEANQLLFCWDSGITNTTSSTSQRINLFSFINIFISIFLSLFLF